MEKLMDIFQILYDNMATMCVCFTHVHMAYLALDKNSSSVFCLPAVQMFSPLAIEHGSVGKLRYFSLICTEVMK